MRHIVTPAESASVRPAQSPSAFSPERRRLAGAMGAAALAYVSAWSWLAPLPAHAAGAAFTARRMLMGTWVDVVVADGTQEGVATAVSTAFDAMARLAGTMSRHDPASSISTLNRAAGSAVEMPAEVLRVLAAAKDISARTEGRFDIAIGRLTHGPGGVEEGRVPDDALVRHALQRIRAAPLVVDAARRTARIDNPLVQVDLGGVAKLPILEAGLAVLSGLGIHGAMINGGGDVLASARRDGRPWRIGLRDPLHPETLLAVLPLHAGVVASSGDYERYVMHEGRRYHHVIDPGTGRPSRGVHGVSLVAESVQRVNGLGTAVMVAGPRHGTVLLARCGVSEALMVGTDGRTWISPALARRLLPPPGHERIRGLA